MQGIVKTSYCDYKFTEEDYQIVKTIAKMINGAISTLTDEQHVLLCHCNEEQYSTDRLVLEGVEQDSDEDNEAQAKLYEELWLNVVR